jgi:hypothetical protein
MPAISTRHERLESHMASAYQLSEGAFHLIIRAKSGFIFHETGVVLHKHRDVLVIVITVRLPYTANFKFRKEQGVPQSHKPVLVQSLSSGLSLKSLAFLRRKQLASRILLNY